MSVARESGGRNARTLGSYTPKSGIQRPRSDISRVPWSPYVAEAPMGYQIFVSGSFRQEGGKPRSRSSLLRCFNSCTSILIQISPSNHIFLLCFTLFFYPNFRQNQFGLLCRGTNSYRNRGGCPKRRKSSYRGVFLDIHLRLPITRANCTLDVVSTYRPHDT